MGCLILGVVFAIVTVIFGDVISQAFDGILDFLSMDGPDFLDPMVLVGGITMFGGVGVMLTRYSPLSAILIAIFSLCAAIILSALVYFFYVKPMQNAENSTGYSIQELAGKIAEVNIPIPVKGYGEVLIKVGASTTHQIAASFEGEEIQAGTKVVIVEVRDDTLYVARFENT